MAPDFSASIVLPDEIATTALGIELASVLKPGDVLLLIGSVGAGKSHLARAIIQSRLGHDEEVPSPTYTLVQTYADAGSEIWHADLYRLSELSELAELGLDDAFQTAICLVEWADRLGKTDVPENALKIVITDAGSGRRIDFSSSDPRWNKASRALDRVEFLANAQWCTNDLEPITGDLSSRSYQRLRVGQRAAVLMDAGTDAESTHKFVRMTHWLGGAGYSVPTILAESADKGLLLLEDFGDERLSVRSDVDDRMGDCIALLADIRKQTPPALPCPSASELADMTELASHYPGANPEALQIFRQNLAPILTKVIAQTPATLSLRDFHTDNIMWLEKRTGLRRLGLLDHQDAFLTHPVYDLVSLLADARRDVSQQSRRDLILEYAKATGHGLEALSAAFSAFSAQRNLRILGIFARAAIEDKKAHHVQNMPRVYGYLAEALEHPIFGGGGEDLLAALPVPDGAFLQRLAA